MPLVRYHPYTRYSEGLRDAANFKVVEQGTLLAHFKYHAGFEQKVHGEIRRDQHFNNARKYKRYVEILKQADGGFGREGVSVRFWSDKILRAIMPDKGPRGHRIFIRR